MARRHFRFWSVLGTYVVLAGLLVPAVLGATAPRRTVQSQPATISFFGINGYFSGYERPQSEVETLLPLGPAIGMRWTREEIVWVNIEPEPDWFIFDHYDGRLGRIANAGYGIIGMLLTTPAWARKAACSGSYWCPPNNVWDYYDFVQRTVERYDGDGYLDAPGSPRVAYWEIWNEPNFPETWWPGGSEVDRQTAYGDLLHVGYQAVKAADPSAKVLVGSVYVWDGASYPPPRYDGLAWLGQVQLRHPDVCSDFDILAIHPHMPDRAPDDLSLAPLLRMTGRLDNALKWDSEPLHYCTEEKPVWVTEVAWSTCPAGQGDCTVNPDVSKTEDEQADYLLRTYGLAAGRGIPHVNVFQLEDKFDGKQSVMWGGCSIVKTDYSPKIAYHALEVLIDQIGEATGVTAGPWNNEPNRFDYRFSLPAGDYVDILWQPSGSYSGSFPVLPGYQVTWVSRDGVSTPKTPSGGYVTITIGGSPGYLRQERPPVLNLSADSLGWLALPGSTTPPRHVLITNLGGGTLSWTATLLSGGQYFSLDPTSGTAPTSLAIQATAPQECGYYTGEVLVDGGVAGQATIDLWLSVVSKLWNTYLPVVLVRR